MILKEPDYQAAADKLKQALDAGDLTGYAQREMRWLLAGILAEKQLAYQLRSYFTDYPTVMVINNLKVEHGGVTAQVDHLVFSRRAIYFIESKSVSDRLHVNAHGEWFRCWGSKQQPMNSPVEQVKRQRQVMLQFLEAHAAEFLGKLLGMQKRLGSYTFKEFVCVSSAGVVDGPGRGDFSNVMKFDQVADAILTFHKQTDKGFIGGLIASKDQDRNLLSRGELSDMGKFLLANDCAEAPLTIANSSVERVRPLPDESSDNKQPAGVPVQPVMKPASTVVRQGLTCKHCGSSKLLIAHGRYGHYFKCLDCQQNTALGVVCASCGKQGKILQHEREFWRVCETCGKDEMFFENPLEETLVLPSLRAAPAVETRQCPKCGAPMILREGKRGEHKGDKFWGCSTYPKCKSIVQADGA